jgi:hypothetical protein
MAFLQENRVMNISKVFATDGLTIDQRVELCVSSLLRWRVVIRFHGNSVIFIVRTIHALVRGGW